MITAAERAMRAIAEASLDGPKTFKAQVLAATRQAARDVVKPFADWTDEEIITCARTRAEPPPPPLQLPPDELFIAFARGTRNEQL
jgi:hypothetical protein